MRNLKKLLALVLALMMVVSVMVTVNAASSTSSYADAVKALVNYGVLEGYDDGLIHEDAKVTRAQMAAIVYRIMTGDTSGAADATSATKYGAYAYKFKDVNRSAWYIGYIGFCANHGVLKGYGDGTVMPDEQIKGYEVQAMLLRALGYDRNNEYTGSDWEYKVLSDATKTGINKDVTEDPAAKTPRGAVAQLTFNAATKVDRVLPAVHPNIGYNSLKHKLIEFGTESTSTAPWGVKTTTYPLTFTWIDEGVPGSYKVEDKAYAEFWTPMTECDIASMMEAKGFSFSSTTKYADFDTYTNGSANLNLKDVDKAAKTKTRIEILDTTHTIGHQGRWTRVYADRIVYVDTFLGLCGQPTTEIRDTGNHVIEESVIPVTIYGNSYAELGTGPLSSVTKKSVTVNVKNDGSYKKGDFVRVNVVTSSANALNDLTEDSIINIELADTATVTIRGILYDAVNGNNNVEVGFTDTNGNKYLYNYTYGYNGGSNITRVKDADEGKTYIAYLDSKGNVLGLTPAGTAVGGYGVVTDIKVVNVGTKKYALEYTILLPNGSTTTVRDIDATWTTSAAAETAIPAQFYNNGNTTYAAANASTQNGPTTGIRNLVTYTPDAANPGYYTITVNEVNDLNKTDMIERGEANALEGGWRGGRDAVANGITWGIVDNNTVFYVANYSYKMGTKSFEFTDFSVTKGFKTIKDLYFDESSSNVIDGATRASKGIQIQYIRNSTTAHVDAVLVLYANKQVDIANIDPVQYPVQKYAYLSADALLYEKGSDYRTYSGAVINGVAGQTLQVTNAAATNGIVNTGLYIYKNQLTNGWDDVTCVSDIAKSGPTDNKVTYAIAKDNWSYNAGVITVIGTKEENPFAQTNNEGLAYNADDEVDKYLTVADNVKVYVVNNKTGESFPVSSDLDSVELVYGKGGKHTSAIAYQFDKDGFIDLIYVIDDAGTSTNPAGPSANEGAKGDLMAKANPSGVSTGNPTITLNVKMTPSQYMAYEAVTFTAQMYRETTIGTWEAVGAAKTGSGYVNGTNLVSVSIDFTVGALAPGQYKFVVSATTASKVNMVENQEILFKM